MTYFRNAHTAPYARNSYGGAKPPMISGFDVLTRCGSGLKPGFYRLSHDRRLLARLVELRDRGEAALDAIPSHVSLLEALQSPSFRAPQVACAGGRGHIIWHQVPGATWRGPSIGLDSSLCESLVRRGHVEWIEFVVYRGGYREVERWHISSDAFLRFGAASPDSDDPCDVPQFRVPIAALQPGRANRKLAAPSHPSLTVAA